MIPYRYLLFFFIAATLYACKKEDQREITDLTFSSDTYYVSEGSELFLYIAQGNQKYQLDIGDNSIIETRVDESFWPAGGIYVTGLQKGVTKLTVKDVLSGKQASITVHVVDPYLLILLSPQIRVVNASEQMPSSTREQIRVEAEAYEAREVDPIIILHRNATQQFFTFKTESDLSEGNVSESGTYEMLFSKGGTKELTLHYGADISTFSLVATDQFSKELLTSFSGTEKAAGKSSSNEVASSIKFASSTKPLFLNRDLQANSVIETNNYFLLATDITSDFKSKYPLVESVWLAQQAHVWREYPGYGKIGDGVLK